MGSGFLELLGDPSFDITESIPEVPACFEAGRALSPVPPCVEGGYRHVQVDRELSHRQQLVESIHGNIVGADPFSRMLFSWPFQRLSGTCEGSGAGTFVTRFVPELRQLECF